MVGEVVANRFELCELVGTGGMSSVFRAHDRLLERTVALKLMHERHLDDDESLERFRREARTAAALSHPSIVTVIDRGQDAGRPYIVFEFVDGENLKQRVARTGPLSVRDALDIAVQVGRALAFAHQRGLVHRDVKPQNVLLNGHGRAKVTDFGIVRLRDAGDGLTQAGTVLGSSEYIAPEQAQGAAVDERTDVYSLAVVLYELLTGDVPFSGDNFVAVAMRHVEEPPPGLLERRPDAPARLDLAIARALAKDPRDRFPSMAAFCDELEACLRDSEQGPAGAETTVLRPRRRTRRRTWPLVALVAAIAALVATIAALLALSGGSGGGSPAPAAPVTLTAVGTYDPPPGDGAEHDADVAKATDGDPGTFWRTESYRSTLAALGKHGVGLVLDAGAPARSLRLVVTTDTPGFSAEILAGSSPDSGFRPVSSRQTVDASTTFDLTAGAERYYVVWITELPPGGAAHVNEATAAQ